jgi:cyclopropane-fatty-acyl-phospholipid synthase
MSDADLVTSRAQRASRRRGWGSPAMRLLAGIAGYFDRGRLTVVAPDGSSRRFGEAAPGANPDATLVVHRPGFVYRVLRGGALGFAEAYLDGEVDTPDLEPLLALFLANGDALGERWRGGAFARAARGLYHRLRPNSKRGSRRNIHAHYDLGNAFYAAWLDPSMTYSSALFAAGDDLEAAQRRKYRRLAERLELGPDRHVLEVGCGWGGFAVTAAGEYGSRVTAVTISEEQYAYARRRIAAAGLDDRVEVRFQDYRDLDGRFDAVASIEMFEAVGEAWWPVYFEKLGDVVRPEGKVGLQVITIDDAYFEDYRRNVDFIQRYIFPGGMLPSPEALATAAAQAGLEARERFTFGLDYARTLRAWAERFAQAWPEIRRLGFDERFRRLWSYYLAYCEAGFRAGTIDVEQIVFQRAG